jgi:aminopeptidase N
MKRIITSLCILALPLLSRAQSVFPVRDEGEARNRTFHVVHYKIEVSFDEQKKMVNGKAAITLVPFLSEFKNVELDAEQLDIHSVTVGADKPVRYEVEPKMLVVHLDKPYSYGDTITVSIEYSCTPKKGLYFTQPDSGYPDKHWQIWSQGEDMDNHFWFPCYDFPNDKATSEMIATVRKGYTVVSNGELVSVKENKKDSTKTFHWRENKPHSSYLITIAAGDYTILHDRAGKLPLQYYVFREDTADARMCFRQTPDMIKFFNEKIGYSYAWEKYAQILITDFIEGGMENTSATSLLDWATVYDARERLDNSPTGLIAHELAHQWWGDVVTCKDWRHLWLNESFASYFDPLYHEYWLGKDEFQLMMFNNQQAGIYIDTTVGRKPIVSVGSYGTNIYPRGAAVLHMLRFVLGDQLFWKSLKHYITKHQFTPVETNDLKVAIEEVTGQNLAWFFEQWVYKAGHPIFDVKYRWSDSAKAIFLSVKQTQKMDSLTGVFRTPVDIEITSASGSVTQRVNILTRDTTFVLPSELKPQLVIFDKGDWILKEVKFDKPNDEWQYQAEAAGGSVDRTLAVRALSAGRDKDSFVPLFSRVSSKDAFWNVRREGIFALGKVKTANDSLKEQIKKALTGASKDPKSSVRSAALTQLGKLRGGDVVTVLTGALTDSSYSVVSTALRALAEADSLGAKQKLSEFLDRPSYRNTVANAALDALAKLDSVKGVATALENVKYGKPVTTRHTALSILHRYAKEKLEVKTLYQTLMNDKDSGIKFRAVQALGEIGDASALPGLEKIAADDGDGSAEAAKTTIEKIKQRMAAKK